MICSGASRYRRAVLLFLVITGLVAVATCLADDAGAQGQLTLADFDSTGLATEMLALIQTGSAASGNFTALYRVSPSVGSLLDGELGVGASDSTLTKIEWRGGTVNDLRIENGSDLDLSTYFGTGGAGADLTLRLQTSAGTGTGTLQSAGASVARWDIDAGGKAILDGLSNGDRLIVALTRALLPAPDQATGLAVTSFDHDSAALTWNTAANADGYTVQWQTGSEAWGDNEAGVSTTQYTITGLQEGTTYTIRVISTRTGGADGTPSSEVSATTTMQPPAKVTGLATTSISDNLISLSWSMAIRATSYRVEWRTGAQSYDGSRQATTAGLSYTVSGLSPSTRYHFRVTAVRTGTADGATSDELSAATSAPLPVEQVTGLSADPVSDSEIRATWNAVGNATGYVVHWDTDAAFPNPDSAEVAAAGAIIERLRAETEYFVRVRGTRLGAADGAWSSADSATTLEPRINEWIARFPGGAIGGQLALALFGGALAGVRFKGMKSPQREAAITGAMSLGALILPFFGQGNNFWIVGIALLVLVCSVAVVFIASRR